MKTTALRLNGGQRIKPDEANVTRNLAMEDVEIAELGAGEVLTEPLFVGVCGSDNSASLGKPNFSWVERPRTIGHECSARIAEVGPGVAERYDLQVGDVVCAVPMKGCGHRSCRGCGRGRPNYCRRKEILGFHRDGAFAHKMVIDAARLMKLLPGISPLAGSVVEPLSVVAQALTHKCTIAPGMDVVVSGCGIIGLMSAEVAKAAGARVAVTGLPADRDVRLALARKRGFLPIEVAPDRPLHEQLRTGIDGLDGRRFGDEYENGTVDLLIECSGAPPALGSAGLAVQLEGTICVIATFPSEVSFEATAFTRSGQTMVGVMGSNREDFRTAQRFLLDGVFPVDKYSQQFAFDDAIRAVETSIRAQTTKAIVAVNV